MRAYSILLFVAIASAAPLAQHAPRGIAAAAGEAVDTIVTETTGTAGGVVKNVFGLPSVGAGLADVGGTVGDWGAGVLNAAGQIL
jgi:hypothetical protein